MQEAVLKMRWSNRNFIAKEQAGQIVMDYVPQQFKLETPGEALHYLEEKKHGSDFRMSEPMRLQTGVSELELEIAERKNEESVLEKLQEVQESAYQEAYQLGLEEGRNKAFEAHSRMIEEKLEHFDHLLSTIGGLKNQLLSFNEAHLVQLTFQLASRLARSHIENNNEALLENLRQSIALAADEEKIHVLVSPNQFDFLEELKNQTGREFEFLKKLKFDPSPDVTDGGCIVETNYGEVDSRIEQRVEKLWQTLAEAIPRVKDKVAG